MKITKPVQRIVKLLVAGLLTVAVLVGHVRLASAQDQRYAQITAPRSGDTVSGTVSITGTATNPTFERYKIEYLSLAGGNWTLITEIKQQVPAGVLAQWKTTDVPDGRYQLRLRVILRDGTIFQDIVQNLNIANQPPTALPTALPSPTPLPPSATPTLGPSPTALIQQPPTATPRVTIAPLNPTNSPGGDNTRGTSGASGTNDSGNGGTTSSSGITAPDTASGAPGVSNEEQLFTSIRAFQNAFCSGVYLAIGGFIFFGVYNLFRLRPQLRRWRQLRNSSRE